MFKPNSSQIRLANRRMAAAGSAEHQKNLLPNRTALGSLVFAAA